MPRAPRIVVPGLAQHLVHRGNNRQDVFFSQADHALYLKCLAESAERCGCAIHAYVLMTNHVHLLVTPGREDSLARMMQGVGRRYVRCINSIHGRSGTLWEGRFKSAVIDTERYLLTCMRYIELNPVRAGMTSTPGEYRWSSYRTNAVGKRSDLIRPHPVYESLAASRSGRLATYRAMFDADTDPDEFSPIRMATRHGDVVGAPQFRDRVSSAVRRTIERLDHGGDRRSDSFHGRQVSSTLTP